MPKIQMIRLKVSANTIPFKSIHQFYCVQQVSEPVPLDTEGHCKCKEPRWIWTACNVVATPYLITSPVHPRLFPIVVTA